MAPNSAICWIINKYKPYCANYCTNYNNNDTFTIYPSAKFNYTLISENCCVFLNHEFGGV